jgi:hypothetical protein
VNDTESDSGLEGSVAKSTADIPSDYQPPSPEDRQSESRLVDALQLQWRCAMISIGRVED